MVKVYGASDDLVEIEGIELGYPVEQEEDGRVLSLGVVNAASRDEVDVGELGLRIIVGRYAAEGRAAHGVEMVMSYGRHRTPVWGVEIAPVAEEAPCPWPVGITFEADSPIVSIDAPDGTPAYVERVR